MVACENRRAATFRVVSTGSAESRHLQPAPAENQSAKKLSSSNTLLGSGVKIWRRLIAETRFS